MGYLAWSARRTCYRNGTRLSQEPLDFPIFRFADFHNVHDVHDVSTMIIFSLGRAWNQSQYEGFFLQRTFTTVTTLFYPITMKTSTRRDVWLKKGLIEAYMMQYLYSYYTNSTKKNVISVCVCKLLETRRFDMFALKQKVRLCWFSPFSPSFSTKNFEQGDTAYHWDCVQRSYQWYGISGLISQTYLLQKWQEAKPRTSLRCSFTRQGKNFHAVQYDLL